MPGRNPVERASPVIELDGGAALRPGGPGCRVADRGPGPSTARVLLRCSLVVALGFLHFRLPVGWRVQG